MKKTCLIGCACVALGLLFRGQTCRATPAWWSNVVDPARLPADYAPANLGQLKWMATNAYVELEAHLPRGAGAEVEALVQGFSPTNNWSPANVGQLKATAAPFWARLIAEGYTNAYPWTESTADDTDNAIANLGQLKYVFDFHLTEDSDDDDLPDWWEIHWFGSITNQIASSDQDNFDGGGDGLANSNEFALGTNPTTWDTDGDGMQDGAEVSNGTDPLIAEQGVTVRAPPPGSLVLW